MNDKIKTMVVDDEPGAMSAMVSIIEHYSDEMEIVCTAGSLEEARHRIQTHQPELLFLDIQLKSRNGFELLDHLFPEGIEVVFVTAFDQYAVEAFKKQALSYLLKPVAFDEFEQVKERAKRLLRPARPGVASESSNRIALPKEGRIIYVLTRDIVLVKADGSYCEVVLRSGEKIVLSKPLKYIEDQDSNGTLRRVHRSYLINPDYIEHLDRNDSIHIGLTGGYEIPVSRDGKKELPANLTS